LLIGADDGLWVLLPGERPRHVLETSRIVSIDARDEAVIAGAAGEGAWVREGADWRKTLAGDVRRVRVMPDGRLLAGTAPAALFASADGTHWEEWGTLQNLLRYHGQRVNARGVEQEVGGIAFTSGTVVGVTGIGTFLTLDEGRSWALHSEGLDRRVHGLWEHPERPDRLYATAPSGFYRSEDAGYSWVQSLHGLDRSWASDVAVLPGAPDTLLLSAARRADGEGSALFHSVDGGISWSRVLLDGEDEWDTPPLVSTLTSPIDALFVVAGGRAWGSHDRGERWFPVAEGLPVAYSFTAAVGAW
jgi:photosystem II stability/assembly factor-like uncharacterized protein